MQVRWLIGLRAVDSPAVDFVQFSWLLACLWIVLQAQQWIGLQATASLAVEWSVSGGLGCEPASLVDWAGSSGLGCEPSW
jgi:hypothetical protein